MKENITIAIADDHVVLRSGLAELIKKLGFSVLYEFSNGKEMIECFTKNQPPDLVLMDISMPQMDGFAATQWLKNNHPDVGVLALSTYDGDGAIIRMLKNGARGYLKKDCDAKDLKQAINSICTEGFYYSKLVTGSVLHSIRGDKEAGKILNLCDRDISFLRWASTELTYKEIADAMGLTPRIIDKCREDLFEKLEVKSRVGLVLFAIKNKIVMIE